MKYLITENKMESIIKNYILKNYDVIDVDFIEGKVHLGSGPNEKGETNVTQKVIIIYINNIKNQKTYGELHEIKSSLWKNLKGFFSLDFNKYGSAWGIRFYQVIKEEI